MRQRFVHRRRESGVDLNKMILPSHFVKNINQSAENIMQNNQLLYCLKFRQMSQKPSPPTILACRAAVLNRVIHRFRGYPE
jgi:hypothetical protein